MPRTPKGTPDRYVDDVEDGGGGSTGNVFVTNFPVTQPISGTVAISNFPASQSVTQGTSPWVVSATDLDIRDLVFASDKVDVSGSTVVTGGLTDAQLRASAVPVSLSSDIEIGAVELKDATTADRASVSAAGALKVDGSAVTQPVSDAGGSLTVDGTVAVSNFPATQPVSGTVAVTQSTSPWVTNDPGLPDTLGQKTMAGSTGVVIASDQTAIPVSGTVTVTPSGTQDENLKQVNGATVNVGSGLISTGTQRVVLASDQPGIYVNPIAGVAGVQNASGPVTSLTQRVVLATDQPVIPISDNGASLTVDGTVAVSSVGGTVTIAGAVTNTVLSVVGGGTEATAQRVTIANDSTGVLSVDDNGGSLTVDGTVAISNFPATQPVSGTVTVTGVSTLAEQQTQTASLSVMDDWDESDRAKVNPIAGQAGVAANEGTVSALTQRVIEASGTTATLANVNDSASSVTLQASNTSRMGWSCFNDSDQALYIKFGATASITSFVVKVNAGGYYEMPRPIYSGVIDGIWAANSTGAARVTEVVA